MFTMAVEAKNKGDEDKIGNALNRMSDEDPTFTLEKNTETHQTLINGLSDMHLDVIAERMKRKFGVDVKLSDPRLPYRETIRAGIKVEYKHKKQSGGHGQYGHVWLQIDPLPAGSGFEFTETIFGGSVPRQYFPAVEKGVREALVSGILAGYPVTDVKVNLVDGSYHDVDSSEMAFKIAASGAFKKGALQAKPILLEPVYLLEVTVPEASMGDIIGDFNSRRGRILGMEPIGNGLGVVKAQAPLAEVFRYSIDLRSMTQGRGTFTWLSTITRKCPSGPPNRSSPPRKRTKRKKNKPKSKSRRFISGFFVCYPSIIFDHLQWSWKWAVKRYAQEEQDTDQGHAVPTIITDE